MVGPLNGGQPHGNGGSLLGQPSPNPGQLSFSQGMDPNQWGWNRQRVSSIRPSSFMQQAPRRGPYMRPGFYPGPRGPPPQHHPSYNQRKPRPNWMPRLVRLPHSHFSSTSNDSNFIVNYPHPTNWPAQTPPSTPAPGGSGEEESSSQQGESSHPSKKKKRTTNGAAVRPWDREAAELALKTEIEFKKNAGAHALVVRFPDPELSKDIIQKYNSAVENVHFQGPCSPRYCFITLREGANVDQVMAELNEVKFGSGLLRAERKVEKQEESVKPEDIDPFTLFIGNLPANISTVQVKEKFPTALRIDVGYAQKMKYTRYAFARYSTTQAALEAYKQSINTVIANRSIVLRFRRNNAPVGPPGEKPTIAPVEPKPGEKLTVGAKLKAKRDKAKQEKVKKNREQGRYTYDDDDDSDDDKVSFEDDDSDSTDVNNDGDEEVDDDEDDGEEEFEDEDDDDEEGEDEVPKKLVEDDDDDEDGGGGGNVGYGYDSMSDDDDDDDDEAMKDSDFFSRLGLRK